MDRQSSLLQHLRESYVGQWTALLMARIQVYGVIKEVGLDSVVFQQGSMVLNSGPAQAERPTEEDPVNTPFIVRGDCIEMFWQPRWCLSKKPAPGLAKEHPLKPRSFAKIVADLFEGKRVAIFCLRYHYLGTVAEVGDEHILLTDPSAVEEFGKGDDQAPMNKDDISTNILVQNSFIERVWTPRWSEKK